MNSILFTRLVPVLTSLVLVIGLIFSQAGFAEEDETTEPVFDLSTITCWEVITLEPELTGTVLFLLYGYASGANEQIEHTGEGIEQVLTAAGEYCAENPDSIALTAINNQMGF